jgi:signal peptidase II
MSDDEPGGAKDTSAEPNGEESAEAPSAEPEEKVLPAPAPQATKKELAHPRPSYVLLAVASLVFFLADIGSKWWVVHHVEPKPRDMTDGWHLRLNRVENPGGAWGVFGDQPDYIRLPFFFIISAVALVFVVSLWKKLDPRQKALKWALPLLLGGALGNLLDRVRHQSVVDFLEFTIMKAGRESFRWPTFNVADIWICVGVGLMAIDMFIPRKPVPVRVVDDEEDDRPAKASV